MSMSMTAVGIRPPDEKWNQMKKAWDSCVKAGVEIPREVEKFFDDEEPDPNGIVMPIPHKEYRVEEREGFEINISDIPKQVTILRFYCSW